MFKLLVLCSVLAAALAQPQFFGTGYAPASPYIATGYAPVASGLISAAPILPAATLAYGGPAHFIKKRQAILPLASTSYLAPAAYGSPLLTSTHSAAAPLYAPIGPLGVTHLLKKRSPDEGVIPPPDVITHTINKRSPQAFLAPAAVAPLAAAPLLNTYTSGPALAYPSSLAYPTLAASPYFLKK